ncbi:MAG: hypothetical protein K9N46_13485 [Candidatus Marinimicrobia bacterium]|nr:hypothetical protein [Candidatus Neomarinimicrobiota bacterium]MCF7829823.1 hypothetical protein [Candidatus Neomarinimicrobiota bacterium]MCF7881744.1 hypothetical protein [Candidatus Neomarinimicrobiota bacterium]
MAKKPKSFADKVAAATEDKGRHCPECGELYEFVQQVSSVQNETQTSWKFNQKMTAVCNCNRSEVLG